MSPLCQGIDCTDKLSSIDTIKGKNKMVLNMIEHRRQVMDDDESEYSEALGSNVQHEKIQWTLLNSSRS